MSDSNGNWRYTLTMSVLVLVAVGFAFRLGVIVDRQWHVQDRRRVAAIQNERRVPEADALEEAARSLRAAEQRRQLLQYIPQQIDHFHAE